jgi:arylsulfatase A-like enzyme
VQTPNIDKLAASGIRFDNAFTACPLCGPARAAMLTGTYPYVNKNVTHPNNRFRTGEMYEAPMVATSLVQGFKDNGFTTFSSGYVGIHAFENGKEMTERDVGFDKVEATSRDYKELVGPEISHQYNFNEIHGEMWEPFYQNSQNNNWPYQEDQTWDGCTTKSTLDFLASITDDKPFFAYVGFRAPHTPWVPPKRFRDLYDPTNIGELPDYKVEHLDKPRRLMERFNYFDCRYYPEEIVRNCIVSYYAFVSYMDSCVGAIMNELERLNLHEDTLVIYTSDHGEMLFEHGICEKHCMLESAIRIPLIFSMPNTEYADTSSDALVENIDILPTALSLCGLKLPKTNTPVNGKSLEPVFQGAKIKGHVFSEYYHSLDPTRMIRNEKYKFIYTLDDINELYDIENDPEEKYNLCMYPAYAAIAKEMEKQVLKDWDIPDLPSCAPWNDLNERKQKQLLNGKKIPNYRPAPPEFVLQHCMTE